ncbi:hypothetical protein BN1012_Phect769 [Candidatus Phaeomarinobacter ectocarpi]|uniref:TIGR02453 family protein n=1 Tax=Candidatus Phaeomarinibacter ectocarpi TaxID=1458461 RepID=X5M790_9HYPH|nr:DUF2461 domain-containing protein [Candidatus Phaeomarinobacter ectocarpi]CDO58983.1 hypothetical protein BN1012_Phect769 [Candidatus Phaeomarinobacter ectocarpi]
MASDFDGFSPDLVDFLGMLDRNNSKAWFDAHRADYEGLYLQPAKDFVSAMAGPLAKAVPGAKAEARVNGSIMRINKDVRFSKDKTPYKPHLSLMFPVGDAFDRKLPALWFRISPTQLHLGCGMMDFGPTGLKTYRDSIADPKTAKAFADIISKTHQAGGWERGTPKYKTVPRGYPAVKEAGGIQADLIRHSGFHMGTQEPHPKQLFTPEAVEFVCGRLKTLKPVAQWLSKTIGTAH